MNTVVNKSDTVVKEVVNIPHDKLLDALFFFWDAFDRASLNYFLTGKTAKVVKSGEDLSGEGLTLGVRRLEWVSGQGRIFKDFMTHEEVLPKMKDKDVLLFTYKGVPVVIKLYDDNPCITTLDIAFYGNETFNIPNPLDRFTKEYE